MSDNRFRQSNFKEINFVGAPTLEAARLAAHSLGFKEVVPLKDFIDTVMWRNGLTVKEGVNDIMPELMFFKKAIKEAFIEHLKIADETLAKEVKGTFCLIDEIEYVGINVKYDRLLNWNFIVKTNLVPDVFSYMVKELWVADRDNELKFINLRNRLAGGDRVERLMSNQNEH